MREKIESSIEEIKNFKASYHESINSFYLKFLSKKGVVSQFFAEFKKLPGDEKKSLGKLLNQFKQHAEEKFKDLRKKSTQGESQKKEHIDLSLPVVREKTGTLHPLSLIRYRVIEIFERLGFNTVDGPEIEDDWHNFSALNFPENHPAREMQDTFFLCQDPITLLRTHTSNVQIKLMSKQPPPIRSIMPGRVYRNETVSARAHLFFNQVEGLYIDKQVSFVDLKQTLYHFAKEMYGENIDIRFRPSFFPFTEPSAEIDISCLLCNGQGCTICKHSGWVEIAGAGMVHPNVLKNCNVNPEQYTGFAFGMGIERIAQLKYRVNDIRLYSENDVRFLQQFKILF